MLCFAIFESHTSLLVDATDESDAIAKARDVAGCAPAGVVPLKPGTFVAEIVWRSDLEEGADPADDELIVAPLEHTLDALELLDAIDPETLGAHASTLPAPGATLSMCASEADGEDGAVYRCERLEGHGGAHEAHDTVGQIVMWED